jgi:hypothetical protein
MTISKDLICGAEQKAATYWWKVGKLFHARRKFIPYKIHSGQGDFSLQERWLIIQEECTKICGVYGYLANRPMSGIGVAKLTYFFKRDG